MGRALLPVKQPAEVYFDAQRGELLLGFGGFGQIALPPAAKPPPRIRANFQCRQQRPLSSAASRV
jgi:hypothetical protein